MNNYSNYPMYGNNQYYMQDLQQMRDRIDQQMRQMSQPMQPQQTPAINQTFQLAPNQTNAELDAKYAKDIDEVKGTLTLKNTFFADKDMSTLWVKNASGDIKTYTLTEVIELDPKDEEIAKKDKEINELKQQMEQMKMMMSMATAPVENKTTENKIEKKSK
jgi:single-stranded DNA-specific DHH superfamily exonuclease